MLNPAKRNVATTAAAEIQIGIFDQRSFLFSFFGAGAPSGTVAPSTGCSVPFAESVPFEETFPASVFSESLLTASVPLESIFEAWSSGVGLSGASSSAGEGASCLIAGHPENAVGSMSIGLSGRMIVSRRSQFLNASFSIRSMVFGSVIYFRYAQSLNAPSPMTLSPFGNTMVSLRKDHCAWLHFANAYLPIVCSESGNVKIKPPHPKKA